MNCELLQEPTFLQELIKRLEELQKENKNDEEKKSALFKISKELLHAEKKIKNENINAVIQEILNEIEACMYKNYYESYQTKASKLYLPKYIRLDASLKEIRHDLIHDSFKRGINRLFETIKTEGSLVKKENLEDYFFRKCYWQLRGLLTDYFRKKTKMRPLPPYDPPDPLPEQDSDIRYDLFKRALAALDERCRKLILSRKLHKVDKSALATELGISIGFINEAVFRCTNKLKKLIEKLSSNS